MDLTPEHGGARFDPAGEFAGMGVYPAAAAMLERYGDKVALALVGPGAEMRMITRDSERGQGSSPFADRRARRAGRGDGCQGIESNRHRWRRRAKAAIADSEAFRRAQKEYTQALMAHHRSPSGAITARSPWS